jgi:uncharacterized protein YqjF (DUF2071 family)
VDPQLLQKVVPYELDLHNGKAYVSLVAFTMENLRLKWGPKWLGRLLGSLAGTSFLNIRTYVKNGSTTGIYFLREVVPGRISRPFGPTIYGLPYRLGKTTFGHTGGTLAGRLRTAVEASWGRLECAGQIQFGDGPGKATKGSCEEFLLERYVCFTKWLGLKRYFRVKHDPWRGYDCRMDLQEDSLIRNLGDWGQSAEFASAHFIPECRDVVMAWPILGHPR